MHFMSDHPLVARDNSQQEAPPVVSKGPSVGLFVGEWPPSLSLNDINKHLPDEGSGFSSGLCGYWPSLHIVYNLYFCIVSFNPELELGKGFSLEYCL